MVVRLAVLNLSKSVADRLVTPRYLELVEVRHMFQNLNFSKLFRQILDKRESANFIMQPLDSLGHLNFSISNLVVYQIISTAVPGQLPLYNLVNIVLSQLLLENLKRSRRLC